MVCDNCDHSYPVLIGVLSAFEEINEEVVNFSEVEPSEREKFLRRKKFAYGGKGLISELFNHYHKFAARERRKSFSSLFLDIGCGIGEHMRYMNDVEKKNYVGVDIDRYKLEIFRKFHPEVILIQMDAKKMAFKSGCVDLVQTLAFLEHFHPRELELLATGIKRLLEPGGKFINCMPTEGSIFLKLCQVVMNLIRYVSIGFKVDYGAHHHNSTKNIQKSLRDYFQIMKMVYFPTHIPSIQLNWFVNEVYIKLGATKLP